MTTIELHVKAELVTDEGTSLGTIERRVGKLIVDDDVLHDDQVADKLTLVGVAAHGKERRLYPFTEPVPFATLRKARAGGVTVRTAIVVEPSEIVDGTATRPGSHGEMSVTQRKYAPAAETKVAATVIGDADSREEVGEAFVGAVARAVYA